MDRFAVRSNYRALAQRMQEESEQLDVPGNPRILDYLKEADNLLPNVDNAREALLDTAVLRHASSHIKTQASRLAVLEEATVDDFVNSLLLAYGTPSHSDPDRPTLDWRRIGHDFARCYLSAPAPMFMNGPLQSARCESRQAKPRPQRDKQRQVVVERPHEGVNTAGAPFPLSTPHSLDAVPCACRQHARKGDMQWVLAMTVRFCSASFRHQFASSFLPSTL